MVEPIFDDVLIRSLNVGPVALTILALYVVKGVCSYLSTTLVAAAGQRAVTDLRNALYEHVLNQSFTFLSRNSTGSLMSHITTDVEKIQNAVSEMAGDLLKEGLTVVGPAGRPLRARTGGWPCSRWSACRWPSTRWSAWAGTLRASQRDLAAPLARHLRDPAGDDLRLPRGEGLRHGGLRDRALPPRRLAPLPREHAHHAHHRRPAAAMEAVGGLALVGALFYGSHAIRAGRLTTGAFTSFLAALFAMYTPIKRLSRVNATLQGALAAGDAHLRGARHPPGGRGRRRTPRPLPRMQRRDRVPRRRLPLRGRRRRAVLRRVVLHAPAPGEVVAIVGTSGAGKTTLVNLLPRFYDVTDGAITIDGVDVREATLKSLRDQIGLVTQETVLFNDTVRANIAYGLEDVDEARIESAARAAFAHDFILDLPRRYDTVIGERGSRLSGGQRQRIAIARALLKDPPILILDEATSALDAESERLVQQALANLMKGRTTLVIAHRLATVRNADRIVVLDGGEVKETGTHEELLRRPSGLYSRLYELQFTPEDPRCDDPLHDRATARPPRESEALQGRGHRAQPQPPLPRPQRPPLAPAAGAGAGHQARRCRSGSAAGRVEVAVQATLHARRGEAVVVAAAAASSAAWCAALRADPGRARPGRRGRGRRRGALPGRARGGGGAGRPRRRAPRRELLAVRGAGAGRAGGDARARRARTCRRDLRRALGRHRGGGRRASRR